MSISKSDFEYVSRLAYDQAALVLEPGKEYLVETRLGPLAEMAGCNSISAFIRTLQLAPKVNGEHHRAVEALTTNETFFFRDFHPFEALRTSILPRLLEGCAARRRLNIWSAACSSGQEPYSVAMLLRENFPQLAAGWDVSILATDFTPSVLKQAQKGRYSQFEVNRGLPASYLVKYFTQRGDNWYVNDDIKQMVEFRQMNLIDPWPAAPTFDLVLLRNVMIYFDVDTKKSILEKVRGCLQPHGYLFLGTAETTTNLDLAFQPLSFGRTVAYGLAKPAAAAGEN